MHVTLLSTLERTWASQVLKAGLGRITENTPQCALDLLLRAVTHSALHRTIICGRYQGVVVLSMSDIPLGAPCVEQCVTRARVQSAPRRSLNSATCLVFQRLFSAVRVRHDREIHSGGEER